MHGSQHNINNSSNSNGYRNRLLFSGMLNSAANFRRTPFTPYMTFIGHGLQTLRPAMTPGRARHALSHRFR